MLFFLLRTGQLAFDSSLPAVRVAVLEGLQLLVDNQHAQPVLKVCLGWLSVLPFLIHRLLHVHVVNACTPKIVVLIERQGGRLVSLGPSTLSGPFMPGGVTE